MYVYNECGQGEFVCGATPGGPCSVKGLCGVSFQEVAEELASPARPVLTLVGPNRVVVSLNAVYVKCSALAPASSVCERGALVRDDMDGDITHRVLACSKDGATNRFSRRGVTGCVWWSAWPATSGVLPI